MSGAFFSDFSVLGVLWWMLGFTLATLRRYNAAGSGSGRPLGVEREPLDDFWVRYPTRRSRGEPGLEAQGKGREGVFGCWESPHSTSWQSAVGSGL